MKNQVKLTFTNEVNSFYDLIVQVNDNVPLSVQKVWIDKVQFFIENEGGEVQTRYSAFGFPKRNAEFLADKLEKIIEKINSSWLNTEFGYEIEITKIPRDYPMEVHNTVHHHFEILMGQVWSPSNWITLVTERHDYSLANAIYQLNEISHELEEFLCQGLAPHFHTQTAHPIPGHPEYVDLNNTDLPPEVLEIFTLGQKPGAVYIQYSQTGKTMTEVLEDDDENIDNENITVHRVTNGSLSMSLGGEDHLEGRQEMLRERLESIALSRNIDLTGPEGQLGRPEIGHIVTDDITTVHEKMIEHPILHSMSFNGTTKIVQSYNDRDFE